MMVRLVRLFFSFEKLLTLICQIENVLNSKPTQLVSAHPNLPFLQMPYALKFRGLSLLDSLEERKERSKEVEQRIIDPQSR